MKQFSAIRSNEKSLTTLDINIFKIWPKMSSNVCFEVHMGKKLQTSTVNKNESFNLITFGQIGKNL